MSEQKAIEKIATLFHWQQFQIYIQSISIEKSLTSIFPPRREKERMKGQKNHEPKRWTSCDVDYTWITMENENYSRWKILICVGWKIFNSTWPAHSRDHLLSSYILRCWCCFSCVGYFPIIIVVAAVVVPLDFRYFILSFILSILLSLSHCFCHWAETIFHYLNLLLHFSKVNAARKND